MKNDEDETSFRFHTSYETPVTETLKLRDERTMYIIMMSSKIENEKLLGGKWHTTVLQHENLKCEIHHIISSELFSFT